MGYALNLSDDNRILSATAEQYAAQGQPIVDSLPEGDISDYKYVNNEYVYSPVPAPTPTPTDQDKLEAQVLYTAMMTDTLMED